MESEGHDGRGGIRRRAEGHAPMERRGGDWRWTATGRRPESSDLQCGGAAAGALGERGGERAAPRRRAVGGQARGCDAGGGGRACGGRAESRLGGGVPSSCAERRLTRRTHVIGTGAEQEGRTQSHRGFHQVVQSFAGRGLLQSYGSELCHTTSLLLHTVFKLWNLESK